jgi:hypothetical protein
MLVRRAPRAALAASLGLGLLAHGALAAAFAPRLEPLWLSERLEQAMARARLLPRQGIAPAPVAVAGYAEPSLVFALGTPTVLGNARQAAEALADQRPAIVEEREEPRFRAALAALGVPALQVGEVRGLDYSNGDEMTLRVYEPPSLAEETAAP